MSGDKSNVESRAPPLPGGFVNAVVGRIYARKEVETTASSQSTNVNGGRQMYKVKLLLFAILAAILTVSVGFAAEESFQAILTGNDELPSVTTKATGDVTFKLSSDGKELSYKLTVKDIKNPTAAHSRCQL